MPDRSQPSRTPARRRTQSPTRHRPAIARDGVSPAPSLERSVSVKVLDLRAAPGGVPVGIPVGIQGDPPKELGLSRKELSNAGFEGQPGQVLVLPRPGAPVAAVGVGNPDKLDASRLRAAAAAFSRAVPNHAELAMVLSDVKGLSSERAGQAAVEGMVLARYAYRPLKRETPGEFLTKISLLAQGRSARAAEEGARRGLAFARATEISRDLANTPPGRLTAASMADVASAVGRDAGLKVEVFDRPALEKLGCGGLLGVNAGSVEPPRMIKLVYRPKTSARAAGRTPHLALVGKGITYDSGGISLKPADAVHATMKNDMSGAGAILAAMCLLEELSCQVDVTGWLMCTDNMPSGSATKLGDVLTIRGGKTVEVLNTDAEGRLVMADALVLATEEHPDAIVDIATLTGACLRALGPRVAGVMGNNQALVDRIIATGSTADEPGWQLP
ncbi:MAG TPA: M17 family peptidase N-terminal domain-containing protein, partial [Tepidiformaceae bacterium]|nr:M17 family peptidase N-terminal domain-containing protein [Tepidiformaceae bacterium]